MKRIQAILDSFVENRMAVGVSAMVYKDGKEAFFGCAGKRNAEMPEAFGRDTIMRMYSMSKVVTAATVMTLFEKGVLAPDMPVYEIIPEYREMLVRDAEGNLTPAARPVTIGHLLTMTSGVGYITPEQVGEAKFNEVMARYAGRKLSTVDFAKAMAAFPLHFQPGEGWRYGHSASVLGGVVSAATGMEFGAYMKQVILDPLGMGDTYFRVPAEKQHRIATVYDVSPEGEIKPYNFSGSVSGTLDLSTADMGGGGLFSTVEDFARFGDMLRKGGEGILKPETVREMTRNHLAGKAVEDFWETPRGYGYGWLVRTMMNPAINEFSPESTGSFGWNGKAATTLRMDPVRGLTVVFGVQRVPARGDELVPPLMKAIAEVWPVSE